MCDSDSDDDDDDSDGSDDYDVTDGSGVSPLLSLRQQQQQQQQQQRSRLLLQTSFSSSPVSETAYSSSSSGSGGGNGRTIVEVSESSEGASPPVAVSSGCVALKKARVLSGNCLDGYAGCGDSRVDNSTRRRRAAGYNAYGGGGGGGNSSNPLEVVMAAAAAGEEEEDVSGKALLSPVTLPAAAFSALPSAPTSFSSSTAMSETSSRLGSASPVRCRSYEAEDGEDEKGGVSNNGGDSRGFCGGDRLTGVFGSMVPLSSSTSPPPAPPLL